MIDFQLKDPSKMKASEMFLIFAKPFLDTVPHNVSVEDYSSACRFCETVWNAIVMKDWSSTKRQNYLSDFKKQIKTRTSQDIAGLRMINLMEFRKKQLFPDVLWAFNISVRKDNGPYPFIVRAEIRMPDPLIPKVPKRWRHLLPDDRDKFINNNQVLH